MKTCSTCRALKPLTSFWKRSERKSGLESRCIECRKITNSLWHKLNKQANRARNKKWRLLNPESHKLIAARTRRKCRAQRLADMRLWMKQNPDQVAAYAAKHRAAKLCATPRWANEFFISEVYHLAKLRTKLTGTQWHVDHIVPLQSKIVCGLHVEHNLQLLPATINIAKNNRWWPDMPK